MKNKLLLSLLFTLSINLTVSVQRSYADATRTVGPSGADYTTLQLAFTAINNGSITGAIVLQITGSITDNNSAVLNASGSGSASYTSINIYPTITGITLSGNYGGPLIDFNGADNVTIDGRVNATGLTIDMTISNISTSGGNTSTIRFINDATYNTIKYCTLQGSATNSNSGIIFFSTTTTAAGNSNNTIDHNVITCAGSNRPYVGIYSIGGGTYFNSSNTISNNNIYNVLTSNIETDYINLGTYNTAWTITGNSFYETTSNIPSSGQNLNIIYINATSGINFTISNNYIGGNAPLCGGTWTKGSGGNTFYFMQIRVGTGTASNIQGNTIKNINFTNSNNYNCYGIDVYAGYVNIGTTAGNCIGSSSGTGSIIYTCNGANARFSAIHVQISGTTNVQNNIIGAITTANANSANATNFYGIYFQSDAGTYSASNNTIGSTTTPSSINALSASTSDAQRVCGIFLEGNSGTISILNNSIANLTNGTTSTSTTLYGRVYGIYAYRNTNTISGNLIHDLTISNANSASGSDPSNYDNPSLSAAGIAFADNSNSVQTISGNTIYNISNNYSSFTGHVAGIYYYGQSTASSVKNNLIYGLNVSSSSSSATIHGIKIDAGVATYSNNIITLGGNSTTTFYGIYDGNSSGTSNIYFNSIYLNGSPTSGSLNSAGLYNSTTADTRNYRNNIFFNARSNNGAGGKHYAMYIQNTGGGLTCDYNDYLASGTGGMLGYYGGDKSSSVIVTGQDTHSLNLDPSFANAGGTNAPDYIPSAALTAVEGTGITNDYGGTIRAVSPLFPEMGAWEQNNTVTWNGNTSNDWSVSGNWTPGSVPTASTNVTIPSGTTNPCHVTLAVSSPAACNNLTINASAVLTIDPVKALTVNGTLTNSAGNTGLVISSDATGTGSLIQSSSGVGATVNRYISGSSTLTANMYHMVSIPVYYSSPTSNLFLGSYLYKLDASQVDPTNSNYYGLWVSMGTPTDTPLSCSSGYMIYYPAASTTYTFTGNLNTGTFTPTVSYGGTYTFNLVPNPYPSAINWGSSGGWVKNNIGATAYIWPAGAGNYTTITASSNYNIPAGQSFIVMTSGSPTLTVNNSACVHSTQGFYKSAEANTLKISAQSNNYYDETFVSFNSSAGQDFDPQFDGFKLWGLKDAPQLWTEKEQSQLSINELPPPAVSLIVPLDFKTSYAGQVTLSVSGVESFDPSLPIRLQDHINGSMTDLRQNSTYVFTHDTTNNEKRFSLLFGYPDGINTNLAHDGKAFISNGRIYLDVPSMQGQLAEITVYDMLGQVIRSQEKTVNGIISIEALLAQGVYIVNVSSGGRNFVTKVINK